MQTPHPLVRTDLPASVQLLRGRGQLPCLRVASDTYGEAEVYLHGAHVTAWHPRGQPPVLWVSRDSAFERGKPIRGGVPICFPWFAAHKTVQDAPMHGFARIREWVLTGADESDGGVALTFALDAETGTRPPAWPHAFSARYRVGLGDALTLALEVTNPGDTPFTFEEALHTYFAVHNVREIGITGLEGTHYLDKVDAFARKRQGPDAIRFTGETDRIYLDTAATCTIHDPGRHRRIEIGKQGSRSTVVWNPWIEKARALPDFGDLEWAEMVCVETANVGDAAITLRPGERHTIEARLTVAGQG